MVGGRLPADAGSPALLLRAARPALRYRSVYHYWKRELRRKHGLAEWRFQSRGWHHRILDAAHYAEKWHYVRENPVRRGLVEQGDAWPHQGRVHALRW